MIRIEKPTRAWWRDSAVAGTVGGVAMLAYAAFALGSVVQGYWLPLDALGVTPLRLTPGPTVSAFVTVLGLFVHLAVAATLGLALGAGFAAYARHARPGLRRSWRAGLVAGLVAGALAWALMGVLVGPLVTPVMRLVSPGQFFVANLVYGVVTGLTLIALSRRTRVSVTFAPGTRVARKTRETIERR